MRRRARLATALLLLLVPGFAAHAQPVLIRAGRLVDPEKGTASTNQQILVEGGVIRAVGPNVAAPGGAQVVDLSDRTVLPGLMDAHTHLCLTMTTQGGQGLNELLQRLLAATLLETNARRALVGVKNARDMLDSGFTTVRDVGNAGNYADTELRKAIEEGLVPGPDRKSTRLNSSHSSISYAVFCLKKKTAARGCTRRLCRRDCGRCSPHL